MADRTKIWIAKAMKKLLKRKSIDDIQVTEICKEAEIERPTFYYHFSDKYELMEWMFFQTTFETNIISIESAAKAMNKMRCDYIFFKRAYEDKSPSPLWAHMFEFLVAKYIEIAKDKLKTDFLDIELQYSIRLYCYGTLGMTREWLLKDNITPAETAVKMMFNSMPENLRKIYFNT